MNQTTAPVLAVIGGTGLYQFDALTDVTTLEVDTPFGKPSAPITLGQLNGKPVAFLARHGIGHHILPHEINYRANIHALKQLGVKRILGVSACGSLREDYAPGDVVIPDNLFDFTRCRERSFFGDGLVAHVGVAQPFCPNLSAIALDAVNQTGATVHEGGVFITIEGPRFSSRAESNTYRAWGMSIIGMTTSPEAFLAREAEMCYTTAAHVTDYDVWHVTEAPVSVEMIINTLNANVHTIQKAITLLVDELDHNADCDCHHALEKSLVTQPAIIPAETRKRLSLLVDRYLPE